jgi:hypothetical protein
VAEKKSKSVLQHAALVGRYDESNTKKAGIGVFVVLKNGRQYLFGETAVWTWRHISGQLVLQVKEHGVISLHAPFDSVACVGGPQVIFRDAEWK